VVVEAVETPLREIVAPLPPAVGLIAPEMLKFWLDCGVVLVRLTAAEHPHRKIAGKKATARDSARAALRFLAKGIPPIRFWIRSRVMV
jgi:hypothetical protein